MKREKKEKKIVTPKIEGIGIFWQTFEGALNPSKNVRGCFFELRAKNLLLKCLQIHLFNDRKDLPILV